MRVVYFKCLYVSNSCVLFFFGVCTTLPIHEKKRYEKKRHEKGGGGYNVTLQLNSHCHSTNGWQRIVVYQGDIGRLYAQQDGKGCICCSVCWWLQI